MIYSTTTSGTNINYITSSTSNQLPVCTSLGTGSGNAFFVTGNNQIVINNPSLMKLVSKSRIKVGNDLIDTLGQVLEISEGESLTVQLPDETAIIIQADGSYMIRYADQTIVRRKPNPKREFNRFVNASDLLEEFIRDLGACKVKQNQVLQIPIELFINWLVIKAAEQDEEEVPKEVPRLEDQVKYKPPRCKYCGKFISKRHFHFGIYFCNSRHFEKYVNKIQL